MKYYGVCSDMVKNGMPNVLIISKNKSDAIRVWEQYNSDFKYADIQKRYFYKVMAYKVKISERK